MPLMGGLETARNNAVVMTIQNHHHAQIICFSASLNTEQQQELKSCWHEWFIFKPATKDQIFETIDPFTQLIIKKIPCPHNVYVNVRW